MKRILISVSHGGFGLGDQAFEWLIKNRGWTLGVHYEKNDYLYDESLYSSLISIRENEDVFDCFDAIGDKINKKWSKLQVVEIPEDVDYTIEDYDGSEWIAEKHRTWPK